MALARAILPRAVPADGPHRRPDAGASGTHDEARIGPAFARTAAGLEIATSDDLGVLQRAAGNRAVTQIVQRQRHGRRRSPKPKPTKDQIAAEIGSALGGPYADYNAFAGTMVSGSFLGHPIARGVRQEFLNKLSDGEHKVDEEFTRSGKAKPRGYGISSIGGFRRAAGYHGWGIAIDIDVARNPYVMHEAGEATLDAQLAPVYNRIAEFMLTDPVGGQQSIVPRLITTNGPLTSTSGRDRRTRLGEYYDRLLRESDAMKRYFALMKDQAALTTFLAGDWKQRHPRQTPPAAAGVTRQMWEDYATLGGAVPRGGPPGIPGFTPPAAASGDRPFKTKSGGQQDPALGFLSIPREVVIGLGRAVSRWGAIDFPGGVSGDIQHFDDGNGLGRAISAAKRAATAKLAAAAAAAGAGSTSAARPSASGPTVAPLRMQRDPAPGAGAGQTATPAKTQAGTQAAKPAAAPLTATQRLSGAHWKAIADARWGGATPKISELKKGFAKDLQRFLDMLTANGIQHRITSAFRPRQRAYLFHYCVLIAKGRIAPKDVPSMPGVDIIWDHGNDKKSREAAQKLADAFGLVGVAALHSNHSGGTAVDMQFDFSGNKTHTLSYTVGGKALTRKIKIDDEAVIGTSAKGRSIKNIAKRELSKAGADFGVRRAVDNDIVHWSRTGR